MLVFSWRVANRAHVHVSSFVHGKLYSCTCMHRTLSCFKDTSPPRHSGGVASPAARSYSEPQRSRALSREQTPPTRVSGEHTPPSRMSRDWVRQQPRCLSQLDSPSPITHHPHHHPHQHSLEHVNFTMFSDRKPPKECLCDAHTSTISPA